MCLHATYYSLIIAKKTAISGNIRHFAQDLYWSICCAHWEAGLSFDATAIIWHPDSHMLSEFTSRKSANLYTYLIKAVYRQLPVAIRKRLYSRSYPGVLCLLCGEVEFSDHVFACSGDFGFHGDILVKAAKKWMSISGLTSLSLSVILLSLSSCSSDVNFYTATLMEFIRFVVKLQHTQIWTIRTRHRIEMEKAGLVEDNDVVYGLSSNIVSTLLAGVVRMLSVIESFAVKFDRYKLCHFFLV
ncbi:hypothetical protein G9A89_013386 [Geosiphon pyriformis]|nr:hypothetical protein G9A89_013386 [Geosiphon pyriformis]